MPNAFRPMATRALFAALFGSTLLVGCPLRPPAAPTQPAPPEGPTEPVPPEIPDPSPNPSPGPPPVPPEGPPARSP